VHCLADLPVLVSKTMHNGTVASRIQTLDAAARISEVARMLGGTEITEATRQHAAEMLSMNAANHH